MIGYVRNFDSNKVGDNRLLKNTTKYGKNLGIY